MTNQPQSPSPSTNALLPLWLRLPLLGVLVALVLAMLPIPAGAAQTAPPGRPRPTPTETDDDRPSVDPKILAERYGPLRFVVDPAVTPGTATIEPVDGTRDFRQVGAIAFPDGETADLVIDHIILHAKTPAERDGFLSRWAGTVLESDEADSEGQMHMVKVDPSAANVEALPANLLAIEPEHVGEHSVSDDRVLKLLALVAEEAAAGTTVTVSWLTESDAIVDGQVFEGAKVPNPKNVFEWPYMNLGSAQDIGVARAWQLLEAEGKLDAHVRLLINDGGFIPNQDAAEKWILSYIDEGESNPKTCSGGGSCPWHGTYVIAAAMAEVDNGYGVAGPAGPLVADVIAVGNGGDVWTQFRRVARKTEEYHARIVNLSWSYRTTVFKAAQEYSANRHVKNMNEAGALVFASAGNAGKDVDEDALNLPCESSRVICVGGMDWNTTQKHPNSNYGSKATNTSVDIYGPYVMWGIADPANLTKDTIGAVTGTSYSSPFVAGIAALVLAADPTLNYQELGDILLQTAHTGGLGGIWWSGNNKRVNAAKAVAKALHAGPSVEITSPLDKSEHSIGASFGFKANVSDYRGNALPVQWASSIEGKLGTPQVGMLAWPDLALGKHVITATAVDEFGESTTDQITIEVIDQPASAYIVAPANNSTFTAGQAVTLTGNTYDIDIPGQVPDNQTKWVVKRNGTKVHEAVGHEASLPAAKSLAGNYVVEFTADGDTDSRTFKVEAPAPGQTPPTATITTPSQPVKTPSNGGDPVALTFAGSGTDKEDGAIPGSRYRWTASSAFGTKVLCTGSSVPGQGNKGQFNIFKDCSSFEAELTWDEEAITDMVWSVRLEVFDSTGEPADDTVTVTLTFTVG